MANGRRYISPEEAMNLIAQVEYIHTFRNPQGILLGADISRKSLEQIFNDNPNHIEIGGSMARAMKHAIVVEDEAGLLFVANDEKKLNQFDPITVIP